MPRAFSTATDSYLHFHKASVFTLNSQVPKGLLSEKEKCRSTLGSKQFSTLSAAKKLLAASGTKKAFKARKTPIASGGVKWKIKKEFVFILHNSGCSIFTQCYVVRSCRLKRINNAKEGNNAKWNVHNRAKNFLSVVLHIRWMKTARGMIIWVDLKKLDGCLRSCGNHVSSRFIDLEKNFMYFVENLKVEVERLESHVTRPFITRHYYENF